MLGRMYFYFRFTDSKMFMTWQEQTEIRSWLAVGLSFMMGNMISFFLHVIMSAVATMKGYDTAINLVHNCGCRVMYLLLLCISIKNSS